MMNIDLTGLAFLIFTGLGTVAGVLFGAVYTVTAILLGWPVLGGVLLCILTATGFGAIFGTIVEIRSS